MDALSLAAQGNVLIGTGTNNTTDQLQVDGSGNFTGLLTASRARIGSTTESRSQTIPTSPAVGDLWLELNSSGYPKYGWHWRWNGVYWLSPDQYSEFSNTAVAGAASYYNYKFANQGFNYFLKTLAFSFYIELVQAAATQWRLSLKLTTENNTFSTLMTGFTDGFPVHKWNAGTTNTMDQHINVATTATRNILRTFDTPNAQAAGQIYFTSELIYNYARP